MSDNKIQINYKFYKTKTFVLFLKGLAMGSADIVPGVSGGTIAFITGIYEKLINGIKSFDARFFKNIFSFQITKAFEYVPLRFLITLFAGVAVAIVSLARVISYLLENYPEHTWSLFFGLILASIVILFKGIEKLKGEGGLGLFFGTMMGFFIVGLIPISTPNTWWFIFISGMIAISAMILPGLSGAFILLLLGKYEYMINALKDPFVMDNFIIVVLFLFGCVSGIMLFSRVVSFLFKKNHNLTVAILTGLIIGSLRKIWPWKEVLEEKIIHGEMIVIKESTVLPDLSMSLVCQILLLLIGFLLVIIINKRANTSSPQS